MNAALVATAAPTGGPPDLGLLRAAGLLGPLDVHFARAMARLAGEVRPAVLVAAALASRHVGRGHVFLDLGEFLGAPFATDDDDVDEEPTEAARDLLARAAWPSLGDWCAALGASPLVGTPEGAADRPLVLAGTRLYLTRYWVHERRVDALLRARAAVRAAGVDDAVLRDGLARLFPRTPATPTPDLQRVAAATAVDRNLAVISGGPGTGKTATVVRILALLVEQALAAGRPAPRIELVAPTGKAAARLSESIRVAKATLDCDDAVRAAIPEEAATIHRRLGTFGESATRFRHDAARPLVADVVVVDEASMVSLALMRRLVEALRPAARLVLLGDKNQLASVEPGAVLGDLCAACEAAGPSSEHRARLASLTGEALPAPPAVGAAPPAPAPGAGGLGDCFVHLTHSYRFGATSGIAAFAGAVLAGDPDRALEVLCSPAYPDVEVVEVDPAAPPDRLDPRLREIVVDGYAPYLRERDPLAQLAAFDRFRVLCARRRGPDGVEALNRLIEGELAAAGLIDPDRDFYLGRPLLVTANDYGVRLFNGDTGLVVPDPAHPDDPSRVRALFLGPDRTPRYLSPSRLPAVETCFAMTVHKAQGSEFGTVVFVASDASTPTRPALAYTAVTRARDRMLLARRAPA